MKLASVAQVRVLRWLSMGAGFDGTLYAEIGIELGCPAYLVHCCVDRSLNACVSRGWARRTDDGFELTDAGRDVLKETRT